MSRAFLLCELMSRGLSLCVMGRVTQDPVVAEWGAEAPWHSELGRNPCPFSLLPFICSGLGNLAIYMAQTKQLKIVKHLVFFPVPCHKVDT